MISEAQSDEDSSSHDLLSLIGHLRDANHPQDQAKVNFVKLSELIKSKPGIVQRKGQQTGQYCILLVDVLLQYYQKGAQSFEMYRGLIYISNMLLALNQGISELFLSGRLTQCQLISYLSRYYLVIDNHDEQYELLALMAQLIQSKGFDIQNQQAVIGKEFIEKLLETDLELSHFGTKGPEFRKILGIITYLVVKQRDSVKSYGLLNLMKTFIMEQLSLTSEIQSQKNLINCLNYLLRDLKFSEVEVQKYKLIEILMSQQSLSSSDALLISALKILRFFWRNKVCRNHMLQLGLVTKLSQLYLTQPELIHGFLLEIVQETRKHEEILKFGFQQLASQQGADESFQNKYNLKEVANLVRLMMQYFGYLKVNQALALLRKGLFDFLLQQLGKQHDQQIKTAIHQFFNQLVQTCVTHQQQQQPVNPQEYSNLASMQLYLAKVNEMLVAQQKIQLQKMSTKPTNRAQSSQNSEKMAVQQEIIDADKKPPYISNFQKQKLQQVTSNDIESIYEQSSISTQDVENEPAVNENQKSN